MADSSLTLINNLGSVDNTSLQINEKPDYDDENNSENNLTTLGKSKPEIHLQQSLMLKNFSYDSRNPRSMAADSSSQRFYNPNFQMHYEEALYKDKSGFNTDFKENLNFFHTVYSLITILKFLCTFTGYFLQLSTVEYFSINLVIILLLFCTQGVILYYMLKVSTAKEKVYYFYGLLIFITIIYFGITNSKAFFYRTENKGLVNIEPDGNLYILILVFISKDLFYHNPLLVFSQSLAGILISFIMYVIKPDSDNNNSLFSLILLCIMLIYLVIYSFRIDFKQKHFFTEFFTQEQTGQKIKTAKKEGQSNCLTRREESLSKCNNIKSIFEKISPLMVCKLLGKEMSEASKELDYIKKFIIDLPIIASNEVSIMLRATESSITRQLTFEDNSESYIKSLKRAFTMSSWPKKFKENFINNWDFNVINLKEPELFYHSSQIALDFAVDKDKISWLDREIFFEFTRELEKGYNDNKYHNKEHAVDVLHSMLHLISTCNLKDKLYPLDWITCIVAALGHDLGHPGKDNLYLRLAGDKLTLRYNDHMILENMHCAKIFSLFQKSGCNFASRIGQNEWKTFRENLIDMILGTNFSTFQETAGKLNCLITEKMGNDCFRIKNKPFILPIILKCADVGHFAKEANLYIAWRNLLLSEYMELPPDDSSDLTLNNVYEFYSNSKVFLKNSVLPLYQAFGSYVCLQKKSIEQILKNLNSNKILGLDLDTPVQSTTEVVFMQFNT